MTRDEDAAEPGSAADGEPGADGGSASARFQLVGGGALILEPNGFRLIEPRGLKRSPIHPYDAICHLHTSERMLWIGLAEDVLSIRAEDFATGPSPSAAPTPTDARDALRARVAALPDGPARIAAIDAVDRLGAHDGPAWVVWTTVFVCFVGTALQLAEPMVDQVGSFLPDLFARGEFWRAITAHFLHDHTPPRFVQALVPGLSFLPLHLAMNAAGLLILGHLVERPLGAWRTAIVLAMSGIGTIGGIIAWGHLQVMGASGLVAGLAGAMLACELHYGDAMPVYWRLPRRLFIGALILQFGVVDQVFADVLAGGAHLGGFAGGYVATWMLGRPSAAALTPTGSQRLGAVCAAALLAVGVVGAWPLARHDMAALERHAARLYDTPEAFHLAIHDNAAAWLIATEGGATAQGLDLAVALADRAVQNTGGLLPGVIDTLAEALFQRGDAIGAVLTIDEAIRLAPAEPYYREQRRRFTGERDADDRPPPPGERPRIERPDGLEEGGPIDPRAERLTT